MTPEEVRKIIREELVGITFLSDRYYYNRDIEMGKQATIKANGTLSSVATSKLGLFGVSPATQAAKINDPSGGAVVDTEARAVVVSLIDVLERFGLSVL